MITSGILVFHFTIILVRLLLQLLVRLLSTQRFDQRFVGFDETIGKGNLK